MTSWNKIANCFTSTQQTYSRQCVDWAGDVFPFQDYFPGNTIKTFQCQPFWSSWLIGKCSSTNCNSIEERVKTRKCLYKDQSEASTLLCFNQSAFATEQCNITSQNCEIIIFD